MMVMTMTMIMMMMWLMMMMIKTKRWQLWQRRKTHQVWRHVAVWGIKLQFHHQLCQPLRLSLLILQFNNEEQDDDLHIFLYRLVVVVIMMVMYMLMVMKMMISYLFNYGTKMVCEQFFPLAHLKQWRWYKQWQSSWWWSKDHYLQESQIATYFWVSLMLHRWFVDTATHAAW